MKTHPTNRISDLETILLWEGEIDNRRIRELFGIKAVQASRQLSDLVASMGSRVTRASSHSPVKLVKMASIKAGKLSPDRYLQILAGGAQSNELLEDSRRDLSVVAPAVFAPVLQAMRKGVGVDIIYRSMNHPEGLKRTIFPHALVRSPRRWHVRAWCSLRNEFRDFTIGRISQAVLQLDPSPHPRSEDGEWNELITLRVIAHPELTPAQQEMIASEYFPGSAAMQLNIRRCLAKYVVQDLRLAVNPEVQRPPEFQLSVHNAKKLSLS